MKNGDSSVRQHAFVVCRSTNDYLDGGLQELNEALAKGWVVKAVHPMTPVGGSGPVTAFTALVIIENESGFTDPSDPSQTL